MSLWSMFHYNPKKEDTEHTQNAKLSKRKNMFLPFRFARQRVRDKHCIYVILEFRFLYGITWHHKAWHMCLFAFPK